MHSLIIHATRKLWYLSMVWKWTMVNAAIDVDGVIWCLWTVHDIQLCSRTWFCESVYTGWLEARVCVLLCPVRSVYIPEGYIPYGERRIWVAYPVLVCVLLFCDALIVFMRVASYRESSYGVASVLYLWERGRDWNTFIKLRSLEEKRGEIDSIAS